MGKKHQLCHYVCTINLVHVPQTQILVRQIVSKNQSDAVMH